LSTPEFSSKSGVSAAPIAVRDVLAASWPLFKASLPTCLPLAVVGVAASATPGAEAVSNGEAHGLVHGREWWALTIASTVLTLICYGAVLRQQLAMAGGTRPRLMDSVRGGAADVPWLLLLVLLLALPFIPAMLVTAVRGFGVTAAVLTLLALLLQVPAFAAWPLLVTERVSPWTAVRRSLLLAHGRERQLASVLATLIAAVLVFILLAGILTGVVMGLAGQSQPTAGGLAFSRWLMAVILALPVVYWCAVTVATWRAAVSSVPANPRDRAPPPAA
jgi:hypothetical protein